MHDHIGYDTIIETGMRDVIFKVLKKIENEGLKGEHHFVITFSTRHFGVTLSDSLKKRFPIEMTIIIQHQYQSLMVMENAFRISLSFSGVLETLTIPYKAISSFADPSVNFGLKFNNIESEDADVEENIEISANSDTISDADEKIISEKVVSLADFKKNRDKKS